MYFDLLTILRNFPCCSPLADASELKDHLDTMYASAAQYNRPPTYPVNEVCKGIDGGGFGDDTLSRIFGCLVAYNGNLSCYVNAHTDPSETAVGWQWQVK